MATITLTRGKTLPDAGDKSDLHELIDLTTAAITNIANGDVSATAAIAGTKISPNFGSQDVSCGAVNSSDGVLLTEATAPTTAANVGALYTKNDGTQTELYFREESSGDEVQLTSGGRPKPQFGAYETTDASQVGGTGATLVVNTEYQASSDGIVSVYAINDTTAQATLNGLVDTTSDPSTKRDSAWTDKAVAIGVTLGVASGEYWKITSTGADLNTINIYFKPKT